MRRFLSGVFAAHPFGLLAGVSLVVLSIPSYQFVNAATVTVRSFPGQIQTLQTAVELVPGQIVDRLTQKDGMLDRQITDLRQSTFGQIQQVQHQVSRLVDGNPNGGTSEERLPIRALMLYRLDRTLRLAEHTEGELNERATALTTQVEGISTTVKVNLAGVNASIDKLATAYAGLPNQIGEKLEPAYLSLLPEITCRDAEGNGYGGCMRGRINGMLGEGVRIGGVFVQRFPELSLSINGIAGDVNKFTTKAVAPRGFWGTVKDFALGSTRIIGAIR